VTETIASKVVSAGNEFTDVFERNETMDVSVTNASTDVTVSSVSKAGVTVRTASEDVSVSKDLSITNASKCVFVRINV
jgi:hypothetical protein